MPSRSAENAIAAGPGLRPLDVTHLNASTFGDAQLRAEIIRLFLTQLQQTRARLAEAATPADWRFVTHTLRGAAAAVGALELAGLASDWEKAGLPESPAARAGLLCDFDRSEEAFRLALSASVAF